jgi:hypothetical protein
MDNAPSSSPTAPAPKKSRLLIKILLVFALLIVIAAVFVAVQPSDFRISRSAKISAPPAAVFPHVNDFHKWDAWSPWAKIDPAMKVAYEGPPEGVGSVYRWSGNNEVGEGVMKIIENRPNELVKIDLEFLKPFAAKNIAEFTFQPDGNQTNVTWTMTGQKNFVLKAVHLFMNMDKMLGDQFEKGLAQLDAVVTAGPAGEAQPAADSSNK